MTAIRRWGGLVCLVGLAWLPGADAKAAVLYLTEDDGGDPDKRSLYQYDTTGNVLTQLTSVDALDRPTDVAYDPVDNRVYITGDHTIYRYDVGTNTLDQNTVSDLGSPTRMVYTYYDTNPRIVGHDSSLGSVYRYTYDTSPSPPPGTTSALGTSSDPPGNVTRFTYDSVDRMVYMTSDLSTTTIYRYDANGNTVQSAALGSSAISDLSGGVSDISSAGNGSLYLSSASTVYRYDYGDSTVTPVTTVDGNITRFTYDAVGNQLLIASTPNGIVTLYTYDVGTHAQSHQELEGLSPDSLNGFAISNVPEPASSLVFGCGMGVALLSFRRRGSR